MPDKPLSEYSIYAIKASVGHHFNDYGNMTELELYQWCMNCTDETLSWPNGVSPCVQYEYEWSTNMKDLLIAFKQEIEDAMSWALNGI